MPKTAGRKPTPPDPTLEEQRTVGEEETASEGGEAEGGEGGGNGHTSIEAEEPAQMEVKMKGTAAGVRTAARRLAGDGARPAVTKLEKEPPEDDGTDALLADPKNMIVVARQLPRVFVLRNGEKARCAVKVDKYTCPVTRDEIEEDVFERFGGKKYKATIHPNTTTGENTILGAFTMEHPDPEAPPYIEDPETPEEAVARLSASIPGGGADPTMRETDNLADMKASLQRRLERAQMMKEIKETERMVRQAERELENEGKPAAPAAPAGPDPKDEEIRRLREESIKKDALLAEKKTDDRFAAMQNSIADLSKAVQTIATRPPEAKKPDDDLVFKMFQQSQAHSKDMLEVVKSMAKPPPAVATVSAEDNFDKMLSRHAKMKEAFGGGDSRVAKFQDQLVEMALERAMGAGEDGGEEEDTIKFAIKQMTPVLKTYVEKQVEKEGTGKADGKKSEVSKERLKEIYDEAARKAAADLKAQWEAQGFLVRAAPQKNLPPGQKKPGLPAPKNPPSGKVVGRTKTSEGVVEHIQIEPTDLTRKSPPPAPSAKPPPPPESKSEETEEVKYIDMPGVGRVEVPAIPGEMAYDRKRSVNYVLDSILSEISEGAPQKDTEDPGAESYAPADALEYLDNEILTEIHKATSGEELEAVLGAWGEKSKLDKIKDLGNADKAVDAWVRRVIRTIQDVFQDRERG